MGAISKALGAAVGAGIGLLVVWGLIPEDFATVNASVIDAAVLIVSTFLGTYFAPPNTPAA
jgi:hypothetical protein